MKTKRSSPVEGGFPLAAVVLLVTTIAALLACIDMPRVRNGLDNLQITAEMAIAVAVAAITGVGVGAAMGLMRRRRVSGLFLGGSVGGLTAAIVVPLTLAPANLWQCLAGMSLLVATSLAVRLSAR